jgi:hypothetical protein
VASPDVRLVGAELLQLRKRRALFWWSLILTVGIVTIVFAILEILHAVNPVGHDGPGGADGLRHGGFAVAEFGGSVAAILVGVTAGAADLSTGVFRELVATGRSRWALYLAKLPGALLLFVPIVTVAYGVIVAFAFGFAHGLPAPGPALIGEGYGFVVLATSLNLAIGLGLSALIGSRATTIGVLLGWQLIAEPLLSQASLLGVLREGLPITALSRLDPLMNEQLAPGLTIRVGTAAVVLVAWFVIPLLVGGWRTATRDA